jgi:hypothetical protein
MGGGERRFDSAPDPLKPPLTFQRGNLPLCFTNQLLLFSKLRVSRATGAVSPRRTLRTRRFHTHGLVPNLKRLRSASSDNSDGGGNFCDNNDTELTNSAFVMEILLAISIISVILP